MKVRKFRTLSEALGELNEKASDKTINRAKSEQRWGGRYHLSTWFPGSGRADKNRELLCSNDLYEIIDAAYKTKLDKYEAFCLSDWVNSRRVDIDWANNPDVLVEEVERYWNIIF